MRLFLILAIFVFQPLVHAGDWNTSTDARIVALSDLHGAHEAFVRTLASASLIDSEENWTGGADHLVIVGDILDRGPDSRESMDLLMRLEKQAVEQGGFVHVLIGNHEAMNLIADLRYVSDEEFLAFADEESLDERADWFARYREHRDEPELTREAFDEKFPAGFFAHRRAFAADGLYGQWLLSKPVIVVVNGTAFVHGGVSPMVAELGLEGINGDLVGEMAEYVSLLDELYAANVLLPTDNFFEHTKLLAEWLPPADAPASLLQAVKRAAVLQASRLHAAAGPLWYRGNATCSPLTEEARLLDTLDVIGADRVVIGHTPTPTRRIFVRMDGAVVEVDTGMNRKSYNGSGNGLIIDGDKLYAVNESQSEPYELSEHPRQVGSRPGGFLSIDDTLELLAQGEIVETRELDSRQKLVIVRDEAREVSAVFTPRAGKNLYPELAAFRLDRLLELNMVPATVQRKIGRVEGSLQFSARDTVDEQQRSASGRGGSARCPLNDQWNTMYVFDSFIFNAARTQNRMLYDIDQGWKLILTGHAQSFEARKGVPAYLSQIELDLNDGWREALAALTDDVIEAEFEDVLDKRRRKSLAKRRDELLAR